MGTEELTREERRELRRKRRIKNLILAYVGTALTILVLIVGTIIGVRVLKQWKSEEGFFSQGEDSENGETSSDIIEQPTKEELLNEIIDARISEMTLEEKVAGLFIVTPESITNVTTAIQAGNGTKTAIEKYPVGGLIYFTKNIQSESQIKEMIANTVSYSRFPLFLAVDEEGGKVARVAEALKLENVGNMAQIGSTGDVTQAYNAMQKVGNYLTNYGFNLNFAPVADVLTNSNNVSIGDRSFGNDVNLVSNMVVSAVKGLQETGITACMKHFPGIGDAGTDTHNGLAVVNKTMEELKATELIPFIAGIEAGVEMIMIGHVSLPQITGDNTPATISEEIISNLLRKELGFDGVVITDAMNMGAITKYYKANDAATLALKAGADMILMPENFELAYKGVLEAVQNGTLSEERIDDSLTRVYRIKYADMVAD